MNEKLAYKCRCGGNLEKTFCEVEFFGINFGVRECERCIKCNTEYLDDKTLADIEKEVKKRKLFGLERNVQITKSGNSLVIRIPPEIANFLNLKYKDLLKIFPVDAKRIELEIIK